jgi:hypothetical protein
MKGMKSLVLLSAAPIFSSFRWHDEPPGTALYKLFYPFFGSRGSGFSRSDCGDRFWERD